MAGIDWDHGQYDAPRSRTILPEGEYLMRITKEERKETSTKRGDFLALELEVGEGEKKGSYFFWNLNCWHESEQARGISRGELRGICEAVGKPRLRDTSELCMIPFYVKIGIKGTGEGMQNTVKGCRRRSNAIEPPAQQQEQPKPPQQQEQPAPSDGPGKPVW